MELAVSSWNRIASLRRDYGIECYEMYKRGEEVYELSDKAHPGCATFFITQRYRGTEKTAGVNTLYLLYLCVKKKVWNFSLS